MLSQLLNGLPFALEMRLQAVLYLGLGIEVSTFKVTDQITLAI